MTEIETYLGYFPDRYFTYLKGYALVCLMLIFRLAKEKKRLTDIEIPQSRQREYGIDKRSFLRGIKTLEALKLISVERVNGNPFRVEIVDERLTDQDKGMLQRGHYTERRKQIIDACRVKR